MNSAYVLEFPGGGLESNRAIIDQYVMPQDTCSGACVFLCWRDIEPQKGAFDWAATDRRLSQWQAAGKKCVLITWGMDYSNPNRSTPDWVCEDPEYVGITCDFYGAMPVPYEGAYRKHYRKFIQHLMQRYSNAQAKVETIRVGLGLGGETYPACYYTLMGDLSPEEFDQVWMNHIAETTAWMQPMPHTCILDAACNEYGDPVRLQVCDFEAQNAAQLGWSFGTQGLSQNDIRNYEAGRPTVSNWLANFAKYPNCHTHLQTKNYTDPTNAATGTGSLVNLIPFAMEHGCDSFELYLQDWRTAYDPTYKDYGRYGAEYRAALESIYQ